MRRRTNRFSAYAMWRWYEPGSPPISSTGIERERLARNLTSRERGVMLLVSQGLSNKEVAARLLLAEGTIKIHLHNIYEKLGIRNRTALSALAIAHRDELRA